MAVTDLSAATAAEIATDMDTRLAAMVTKVSDIVTYSQLNSDAIRDLEVLDAQVSEAQGSIDTIP